MRPRTRDVHELTRVLLADTGAGSEAAHCTLGKRHARVVHSTDRRERLPRRRDTAEKQAGADRDGRVKSANTERSQLKQINWRLAPGRAPVPACLLRPSHGGRAPKCCGGSDRVQNGRLTSPQRSRGGYVSGSSERLHRARVILRSTLITDCLRKCDRHTPNGAIVTYKCMVL